MNHLYLNIVSGRVCPAIPHYNRLARLICKRRNLYDLTLEECRDLVRPLVKELKAQGVKATISNYTRYLHGVKKVLMLIRQRREARQVEKATPSLDERIAEHFYMPYFKDIKCCVTSNDSNMRIVMHRGEPKVEYHRTQHGYGWGSWTELTLHLTFQKGWSRLAAKGMHRLTKFDGQYDLLVLGFTPKAQGDLFENDDHAMFTVGTADLVKRGVGDKTLVKDVPVAFHAGKEAAGSTMDKAAQKLFKKVIECVTQKLD